MPADSKDQTLIVGRFGAAHGIRGWSVLISLTDPRDNLLSYAPLLINGPDGWRPMADVEFSRKGEKLLVRFAGNTDRTQAEALRGREIGLAAADLPAAEADEFYWRDLIGLRAQGPDGRVLGDVVDLLDTAAHAVLVIRPSVQVREASGTDGDVLVPFVEDFTGAIDLNAGTIDVDWPEFDDAVEGSAGGSVEDPAGGSVEN